MMQVARTVKGEVALMILSVDSPVDESTLKRVRQLKGILNVKVVFM
jgi:nitrate reductase NapAB chaperone NapD